MWHAVTMTKTVTGNLDTPAFSAFYILRFYLLHSTYQLMWAASYSGCTPAKLQLENDTRLGTSPMHCLHQSSDRSLRSFASRKTVSQSWRVRLWWCSVVLSAEVSGWPLPVFPSDQNYKHKVQACPEAFKLSWQAWSQRLQRIVYFQRMTRHLLYFFFFTAPSQPHSRPYRLPTCTS
jgi:hypothetical protein